MEVSETLEELMTTMEILKQIEADLRASMPKVLTEQEMTMIIAILDLIANCNIPDVRFIPSDNTLIGEA